MKRRIICMFMLLLLFGGVCCNVAAEENQEILEETENMAGSNGLQSLRLDIEGISPNFEKDIYEYYLTVSNDVKQIEVAAEAENSNAKVTVTGNTSLKNGLNTIEILVTSQDGNEQTYSIYVTKTANLEAANTNLEILAIENVLLSPPFDTNETSYKAEVSNDTESLNIFAVPENENAKVQIEGGENLVEGDNIITVVVTADNGYTTKKYQVEVYKRSAEEQAEYNEEQSEQLQNVGKAYEATRTSTTQGTTASTLGNAFWYVLAGVVLLATVAIFFLVRNNILKIK